MPAEHLTVLKKGAPPCPLDTALAGFLLDRQAARCTRKTLQHYEYSAGHFVAWLKERGVPDLAHITPSHVRAYLVSLQERGLKDTTQHAQARGIKAWLNWLVKEGELAESPMRRVAMPRLERRIPAPFTLDDVRKLLAACDRKTGVGARNYALVLVLLDTGLRAAECAALRVGDIDMRTGLATIMGKGGKQRQVRVGNRARAALLRYLDLGRPQAGDPLWRAYGLQGAVKQGLTLHGLQMALVRLGRKAGVTPCGPHRFRRTFALWCLRDGMDLHSLRLLMGHSDLDVLQRYLKLAGEDVERAHAAHSPVDTML